ncbi:hypothetical protein LIER_11496 [Lithospermum erythrorhizon]|uniref:C3H1-type domain-containing protein n=1 Tax=Lithospermum erythrorhizon TaxID=34254 RepID=A0AAV3PQH9_LITER
MEIKEPRKVSVFNNVGGGGQYVRKQVCAYWLEGRCNRNPCRFMHRLSPAPQSKDHSGLVPSDNRKPKSTWRNANSCGSMNRTIHTNEGAKKCAQGRSIQDTHQRFSTTRVAATCDRNSQKGQVKMCQYWLSDNCVHGEKCKYLHSYFSGSGFSMLTMLDGHTKAVTGIALPSGSDKLYSGSKDGSVRVWDCHSGQCVGVVKLDTKVCCLISEGQWVFVGLQNAVKVWNLQRQTELHLNGPVGQVCSMVVSNDMLFAGVEGGCIFAWKFSSDQCSPELVGSLKGHDGDVVAVAVGASNRLYSGSKDNTVKVWDLQNMQCLQTLCGHSSDVTSVLCWDNFLLSGSLDNTIKVWAATDSGLLEVVYEHREESGILSLEGIHDAEAKPILLCSCKGNNMKLYELPSLAERGRIFAKRDIQSVQIASGGLFFSGDETGQVFVWKLDEARS